MTGSDIIDLFREIIDEDSLESAYELDLLNTAKDALEGDREWEFLKKLDTTTLDWATSDTYLTSHTLPSDFMSPVTVYMSGDLRTWTPVPLEHRERFKDLWGRYYIDYANKTIYFTGKTSDKKDVTLCYLYTTPELTVSTSPVWLSKFHRILAYRMAEIHQGGTDSDIIAAGMGVNNFRQYQLLKRAMEKWDDNLKLQALNYSVGPNSVDVSLVPDVVTELSR